MKRHWLTQTMVVLALLAAPARRAQAGPGEEFWKAYSLWVKMTQDLNTQLQEEPAVAQREKRAPRPLELTDTTYRDYLAQVGSGPGCQPMILTAKSTQLNFWLVNLSLHHKVEDLETAERELWKQSYKPDRTADFAALYNRYMAEHRYADAVRIAKECTHDYAWAWNVRDWQDWTITAMANDPKFRSPMATLIIEFGDAHRNEIGANDYLLRYLGYLEHAELWGPAARVADACLRSYQDCDWEPGFLVKALNARRHLLLPPPTATTKAEPEPPAAAGAPKTAGTTPPPVPGLAKGPTAAPAAPVGPESTRRLMDLSVRCVKRCPYNPETATALLEYFTWTQQDPSAKGPLRDAAARLVGTYLTESKKSPEWFRLWQVGKDLVESTNTQWAALAEEAKREEIDRPAREIKLKAALATDSVTNQARYVEVLLQTAGEFPETVQAQIIISNLVTQVMRPEWELAVAANIPTVAAAIRRLFPKNPVYASLQLQRVGALTLPAAAEVYTGLISRPSSPLQTEWYYYMNHRRCMGTGSYDLDEFQRYATKCRGSYYLPVELYGVCVQALYNQHPDDACRACEILTDKLYATSFWAASMFAGNIGVWSPTAVAMEAQAAADAKASKHAKHVTGGKESARAHADYCDQQANMIEQAQGDKINLGYLYYNAVLNGNKITFHSHLGLNGKRILQSTDYRDSFWYFYSKAYEK